MEEHELHQSKLMADSLIKQFGDRARPIVESVMQIARRLYEAEAERDQLQKAFNNFALQVFVEAIAGSADAAIIANQPMNEHHSLSAVKQLAQIAKEDRAKRDSLKAELEAEQEENRDWAADFVETRKRFEAEQERLKTELQAALDHARAMEEARNVESLEAKRLYYMLKDIQGKCISAGASAVDYSARGETVNALYLALDTLRRIAEGTYNNELIR